MFEGGVANLERGDGGGFEAEEEGKGGGRSRVDESEDWVEGVGLDLDGGLDEFGPGVGSSEPGNRTRKRVKLMRSKEGREADGRERTSEEKELELTGSDDQPGRALDTA